MKKQLALVVALYAACILQAQPSIEWQKCLGGGNSDEAYSIQQTSDGGYIVAGSSISFNGDVTGLHGNIFNSSNYPDYWVVKLDGSGTIQWQKCLGGGMDDKASSIRQTTDGGYIVAGYSRSTNGDVTNNNGGNVIPNGWIVKLSVIGDLEWQKSLSGNYSYGAGANSIQQTMDGGYIVAGVAYHSEGGIGDCWVAKLNGSGIIEWQKNFGGGGSEKANSIQQTMDSGYILSGYSSYSANGNVVGHHGFYYHDYWVLKLDISGNIQWQKCLGGSKSDEAYSIQQTTDGGYIVAGYSESNDGDITAHNGSLNYSDYWVSKLDDNGSIQWQKSLGGTYDDEAHCILQDLINGGYIIAGYSSSTNGDVSGNHGSFDFWIVKLDDTGSFVWQKCLGGTNEDRAYSIQQTTDGGLIVAGYTRSNNEDVSGNHGSSDFWIVKLSSGSVDITVEKPKKNNLTVYPNPSSGLFTIETNEQGTNQYYVYDAMGKLVLSGIDASQRFMLDLSHLPDGTYMLQLKENNTLLSKVKQF